MMKYKFGICKVCKKKFIPHYHSNVDCFECTKKRIKKESNRYITRNKKVRKNANNVELFERRSQYKNKTKR